MDKENVVDDHRYVSNKRVKIHIASNFKLDCEKAGITANIRNVRRLLKNSELSEATKIATETLVEARE